MKSNYKSNRFLKVAVGVVAFLILVVGLLLALNLLDLNRQSDNQDNQSQASNNGTAIYIDGSPYKAKSDIETIMFIGTDKYESDEIKNNSFRNDMQNDFNFLLVIDNDAQKITPILINRDTMTDIQTYSVSGKKAGMQYAQLALAHTYGSGKSDSCINVIDAVSNLLYDVSIEHYAAISLDAIPILNDAVGGVKLTVQDDLSAIDSALVKGAEVTLSGEQAETYIRSRYGLDDSTNENRMQRQKQYISEWLNLAKQSLEQDSSFAENTILKVNDYLTTDMSVSSLSLLAEKISTYDQAQIAELTGVSKQVDGYMQFTADEKAIKEIVIDNFFVSAVEPYKE